MLHPLQEIEVGVCNIRKGAQDKWFLARFLATATDFSAVMKTEDGTGPGRYVHVKRERVGWCACVSTCLSFVFLFAYIFASLLLPVLCRYVCLSSFPVSLLLILP